MNKNERLQLENKNLLCLSMLLLNDVEIGNILLNYNIATVGIYGMNAVGRILKQLLEKKGIKCIAIDQRGESIEGVSQIYSAADEWPDVDIFVVTGEVYWDEIQKNISRKSNRTIVKASDFLEEVLSVPQDYRK